MNLNLKNLFFWEGGGGGGEWGAARVSDVFKKNPNLPGGGGAGIINFFILNPNLKYIFFFLGGGGEWGLQLVNFLYKEAKSKKKIFLCVCGGGGGERSGG